MRKALAAACFAFVFALGAAACDDGETTNTNSNQTCTSDYACVNNACACGTDGSGASCTHPDDTDASDAQNCSNKCKVCQ